MLAIVPQIQNDTLQPQPVKMIILFSFSGPLAPSYGTILFANYFTQNLNDSSQSESVPTPTPKNEALGSSSGSHDWIPEVEEPGGRQTNTAAPCGILKHLPALSSTDTLLSQQGRTSPVSPGSPSEAWIDRKQVRFSPMVAHSRLEWQRGKELGEHSVLDVDSITPSLLDEDSDLQSCTVRTCDPFLHQSTLDAQEGDLTCGNKAEVQEQQSAQPQLTDGKSHSALSHVQ